MPGGIVSAVRSAPAAGLRTLSLYTRSRWPCGLSVGQLEPLYERSPNQILREKDKKRGIPLILSFNLFLLCWQCLVTPVGAMKVIQAQCLDDDT